MKTSRREEKTYGCVLRFDLNVRTNSGWVFDGETEGVCSRQKKDQRLEKDGEPREESLDRGKSEAER